MTPVWLIPHWAQILVGVFVLVVIVLSFGNFKQ